MSTPNTGLSTESSHTPIAPPVERLKDVSPRQWKSGIAAWLGWFFDGLDMHLYTLVAASFVAQLLAVSNPADPIVKEKSAWIQASFLIGWALGGGFFGMIGDKLGRSRTLSLTILTYALFTGLSFFVTSWWQLLICRFLAALGIGGEWAVGASLLSETWPKKWRVWIAAILQTGVNLGVLAACVTGYVLANQPERYIFLVGVLPAFIVFWVRKNVPEPDEWHAAKSKSEKEPGIMDLFRGNIRHITLLTSAVCALTLTGWWAFMFWHPQHLRSLPELANWTDAAKRELVAKAFFAVVGVSIAGNFFASGLARWLGYRRSILCMCLGFFAAIYGTYSTSRGYESLLWWLPVVGFFSGVFGLFTMYLPPLFPTLLRTTGAGFCFNIGRIAAACGTVLFLKIKVDFQTSLMAISFLFLVAAVVCLFLPELSKAESERERS